MSDDLSAAGNVLLARLLPLVAQDPELLATVREIAGEFLRRTEPVPAAAVPMPVEVAPAQPPLPELTLGTSFSPPPATDPSQHATLPSAPSIEVPAKWLPRATVAEADLQIIEARCRLKSEGSRWAANRQRRLREGADYYTEIEPKDREIISKAKALKDCFLWMNHSTSPIPDDLQSWEDIAGCFEAAAMAASLLREVVEGGEKYREFLEPMMDLAAEAQSALRIAVQTVNEKPDTDQLQMFLWIRELAREEQILVARYMRLDDPAEPTRWHDLQERIGALDSRIDAIQQKDKERIKLLKKGQYHARSISKGGERTEDWKKVIEVIDTLVTQGVPPSSTDLRDLLVPIIDNLPEGIELPSGFQRVMVEVDRYLSAQSPPSQPVAREVSEEVKRVAAIYQGKSMVLIGGDRRLPAYEALKSAFALKDLIWIATREHESIEGFIPYIARDEVAAVLLAIRWSSHSYGDVKAIAGKHGKEFFWLPGGYNPNQVAHQILEQRGEK